MSIQRVMRVSWQDMRTGYNASLSVLFGVYGNPGALGSPFGTFPNSKQGELMLCMCQDCQDDSTLCQGTTSLLRQH